MEIEKIKYDLLCIGIEKNKINELAIKINELRNELMIINGDDLYYLLLNLCSPISPITNLTNILKKHPAREHRTKGVSDMIIKENRYSIFCENWEKCNHYEDPVFNIKKPVSYFRKLGYKKINKLWYCKECAKKTSGA